jgi:hypothetical protein
MDSDSSEQDLVTGFCVHGDEVLAMEAVCTFETSVN